MQHTTQKIGVVGLGYVGLPLALLAEKRGYDVVGIDTDPQKVDLLSKRVSPLKDARIAKQVKESSFAVSSDAQALADSSLVVICVPTPVDERHAPDLRPLIAACASIGKVLQKGQLVILESTVNPGISETIVIPALEKESGLKAGNDFSFAHCPERINPGDTHWTLETIPRVLGSLDVAGLDRALAFYQSLIVAPIKPMASLKETEAVKVVENAFRDINIAFVNELALSFSKLGIDVVHVIQGAATKPFSFMPHFPGCGVGGHCIPVDPYYLIEYAKSNGFEHDFLSLARRINNYMPEFTAGLVVKALNEKGLAVKGSQIALLGLSYKPGIDDIRESPSFEIVRHLLAYGANVIAYDPYVLEDSAAQTLEQALTGSKAVVVATAHKEFLSLTPDYLAQFGIDVVVDGRNCLAKELFQDSSIIYKGIGR